MNEPQPIDGEFGLDYQLFIFHQMIKECPDDIEKLLSDQLNEVVKAMIVRSKLITIAVFDKLADVRLDVLAMEFDNEASKRERDELQRILDELT